MQNPEVYKLDLSDRVQLRMAELGINSHSELARRGNFAQSTINRMINRRRGGKPSFETIEKLKVALEVDDSFFWGLVSQLGYSNCDNHAEIQ
jgi:transcriptional regulator with XRE-family HTH domain